MDFEFDTRVDTVALSETGVALELRDARGEVMTSQGGPVTLILLGPDSATYRNVIDKHARARLEAQMKAKAAGFDALEVPFAHEIAILTDLTTGWLNVNDKAGAPITFTADSVKALYAYPAIREQADFFCGRRANFLKASQPA